MTSDDPDGQCLERVQARCMRKAVVFAVLSLGAGAIGAVNLMAVVRTLWQPSQFLALPLYMLFAAASLLACLSFVRSSRRLLRLRAESRQSGESAPVGSATHGG